MPSDPYSDDFLPTEEEIRRQRESVEGFHGRSAADDILDAVDGLRPVRQISDCPLCGGETRLRQPGVGAGVAVRRCRDPECRNEFPVGMRSAPGARRAYVSDEYPAARRRSGPYAGQSASPSDQNSPTNRQVSEYLRQVRTNEP